jgi:hypothetical protein
MSIDWDALVLGPVMAIFGEGVPDDAAMANWPLYTPRGLAGFRLAAAVFDAEYEQVDINADGSTSTSRRPVLGVRVALFPRMPAQNDKVTIPATGKTYVVRDVQSDGHGHAKLMLMEAAS